jgi:hypothetical protein
VENCLRKKRKPPTEAAFCIYRLPGLGLRLRGRRDFYPSSPVANATSPALSLWFGGLFHLCELARSSVAERRNMARPSSFTQKIADLICERIADGESLRKICMDENLPDKATVFRWLAKHDAFCDQYARAREAQADTLADEILDISDDGRNDTYESDSGTLTNHDVIARSRLRVDARKWLASKMAPKKYGDKLAVGGADDLPPVMVERIERVIVRPKD